MTAERTLVDLFFHRTVERPNEPALLVKQEGTFQEMTWKNLGRDVLQFAAALSHAGITTGDRVAQLSENRYEWIVADLAILSIGAVHVPLHATLSGEQAAYQIRHSGSKIVLISNAQQAEKLARLADDFPKNLFLFSYDQCTTRFGGKQIKKLVEGVDSVACELEEGRKPPPPLSPDSLASILYTSGTTGEPKGVMLSHANLLSNATATLSAFGQTNEDLRLCFLPLSHIFARTCDLSTWIVGGGCLALAERPETVIDDARTLHPTMLCGVPYFFEKVVGRLRDAGQADTPGRLQEILGGSMRVCFSGGAALPEYVLEFFELQDLPLLQGYGLTESSPVITASTDEANRRGAVGHAIPGVEIRLADDGEILTRGPHVMQGYWQDQEATDEVIREGWLHTGDLGQIDDHFLRITGRKKEMIVTSAGKNIAPVYIESLLTADPFILQALVIGNDRNYLSALIVPDPNHLKPQIKQWRLWVFSKQAAVSHRKVRAFYNERIQNCLSKVSHHEQVRAFTLLPQGFTLENGEVTTKGSPRRTLIQQHYAQAIEKMYEG